ncbi:hypothetical protein [Fusobacterium varium]|uniref:hypothetical protein n=1 Tax=Fusobacterium varium TaxID=856 RepID=UPI003F0F6AC5
MNLLEIAKKCKNEFNLGKPYLVAHKHSTVDKAELELLYQSGILKKNNNLYFATPELDYFIEHNGKTKIEVFTELNQIIQILSCSSLSENVRFELEQSLIKLISDTQKLNIEQECSNLSTILNKIKPFFPTIKELVTPLLTEYLLKLVNLKN